MDLHVARVANPCRAEVFAGNVICVNTEDELQGLITLANTLYLYSMWLVPEHLRAAVQQIVDQASMCVGNWVVSTSMQHAEQLVQPCVHGILQIGLPVEYLLESKFAHLNLPDGAAKHLLNVADKGLQDQLAMLLRQFKDVCPAKLPLERVDRGIHDVHEIKM